MTSDTTHVWLPLDEAWTEVIFAAFHDPAISATLPVDLVARHATGVVFRREWCWSTIRWETGRPAEPAATLQLACGFELHHYDTLLVCLTMPVGCRLRVADTVVTGTGQRAEVAVPLPPGRLESVRLDFIPATAGPQVVWLAWLGLRDTGRAQSCRPPPRPYDPLWPGLIKPRAEWGTLGASAGLLFDSTHLAAARAKLQDPVWRRHADLLQAEADRLRHRVPEADLGAYLPLADRRYVRVAEAGREPYQWEALLVGFLGLLHGDRELVQLALRYLMCLLHTPHWVQSAESRLPGSTWDQRCFVEEMTTTSVCLLTDWFGSLLTPRALELARQSVWDKGLAFIERDLMKWAYLADCTQGVQFGRARVLGGLLLERAWPHLDGYTDRAYRALETALARCILPDGGVAEGPGYFCQAAHAAIPALIAVARARGQSPADLLRRHFGRCEAYVRALSGTAPGSMQPDGDCRLGYFYGDLIPVLAAVLPDSAFSDILQPCLDTGHVYRLTGLPTNSGGWLALLYGPPRVAAPRTSAPTFAILPQTGQLASLRSDGATRILVHLTGCPAQPPHSHLDKGAFTVELDGLPFLLDRGMVRYDDARAEVLHRTSLHNCLTPELAEHVFADQAPPAQAVIPTGAGDETRLQATVDLAPVWREHMERCQRELRSESPAEFHVVDRGKLNAPGRVAFHLHAPWPFRIAGQQIWLEHAGRSLEIVAPWAATVTQGEDLIDYRGEPVQHLVIHSPELQEFELTTQFRQGAANPRHAGGHAAGARHPGERAP